MVLSSHIKEGSRTHFHKAVMKNNAVEGVFEGRRKRVNNFKTSLTVQAVHSTYLFPIHGFKIYTAIYGAKVQLYLEIHF